MHETITSGSLSLSLSHFTLSPLHLQSPPVLPSPGVISLSFERRACCVRFCQCPPIPSVRLLAHSSNHENCHNFTAPLLQEATNLQLSPILILLHSLPPQQSDGESGPESSPEDNLSLRSPAAATSAAAAVVAAAASPSAPAIPQGGARSRTQALIDDLSRLKEALRPPASPAAGGGIFSQVCRGESMSAKLVNFCAPVKTLTVPFFLFSPLPPFPSSRSARGCRVFGMRQRPSLACRPPIPSTFALRM